MCSSIDFGCGALGVAAIDVDVTATSALPPISWIQLALPRPPVCPPFGLPE